MTLSKEKTEIKVIPLSDFACKNNRLAHLHAILLNIINSTPSFNYLSRAVCSNTYFKYFILLIVGFLNIFIVQH